MNTRDDKRLPPHNLGLEHFHDTPVDQGLSLEELSASFARLIGKGHDPYDGEPHAEAAVEDAAGGEPTQSPRTTAAGRPLDVDDDPCPVSPRTILESMLFIGHPQNHPLSSREVAALMRGVRPQEVDELVAELNRFYEQQGCPYRVISVGGGYRLELQESFLSLREKFYGRVRHARLSQAAVDVLSIVAYHQPVARVQIDQLRGDANSGRLLSQLVRRELLWLERGAEGGASTVYRTTQRFLDVFDLRSLDELPRTQELDELS